MTSNRATEARTHTFSIKEGYRGLGEMISKYYTSRSFIIGFTAKILDGQIILSFIIYSICKA